MQIIKVTLGLFLLTITAFFSLKFYGLSQTYEPYDHPLFKKPLPWIFALGGDKEAGPSHSGAAINRALEEKGVILAVHLLLNAQNHFYGVPIEYQTQKFHQDGKVFSQLVDSEVMALNLGNGESPLSLEQILEKVGTAPVFLWIGDNRENSDLLLERVLRNQKSMGHFFIHSEFDVINKSIKKLLPQLLFGTGVGQRTRLLMLGSIGLESLGAVDGDFVVSPLKQQGVSVISEEMGVELARRKMPFIIGPLEEESQIQEAITKKGAGGYMTGYPQKLKRLIDAVAPRY